MIGKDDSVEVTLCPEPTNPIDARAIASKCYIDSKWQHIGYIVQEAGKVHEALERKATTRVSFEWVKLLYTYKDPGWYTGINITRIGEWSNNILKSQSAKH